MRDKAEKLGRGFTCNVNLDVWIESKINEHKASVSIQEDYYESAPYKSEDLALSEVKGWLESIQIKIESTIKKINQRIAEFDKE